MTLLVITAQAEKPKHWCEVRGLYQTITTGEGSLEICRLVGTAVCYYIPCSPTSSYSFTTTSVLIPNSIKLEEGQDFWARRENGTLNINYLLDLNITHEIEDEFEVVTIIH